MERHEANCVGLNGQVHDGVKIKKLDIVEIQAKNMWLKL